MATRPRGETDNCRNRLLKYCDGQGLDLGCGNVKIKIDAIGIQPFIRRDTRYRTYPQRMAQSPKRWRTYHPLPSR